VYSLHPCFLLLDTTAKSTPFVNGSSLSPHSEAVLTTSNFVIMTNSSSSNSSSDDDGDEALELVPVETLKTLVGPVLFVTGGASTTAATQRYTVDVVFHHSSYVLASHCQSTSKRVFCVARCLS